MSEKYYSLTEAVKLGYILRPDGQPYNDVTKAKERIVKSGYTATHYSSRSRPMYRLTETDIAYINQKTRENP